MDDIIPEKLAQYSCYDVGYVDGLIYPMDPEIRPVISGTKMLVSRAWNEQYIPPEMRRKNDLRRNKD